MNEPAIQVIHRDDCRLPDEKDEAPGLLATVNGTTNVKLPEWAERNSAEIQRLLALHGAVLLRGFNIDPAGEDFARFAAGIGEQPLAYTQRSTKRVKIADGIYTSTEYPAHKTIALHSENAFQNEWPQRIMFYCVTAAETGGATPIADNAAVHAGIDPEIRQAFIKKKIRYVRNFGGGLELPWQEAFQTDERQAVEDYCRQRGISWGWKADDRLMTVQTLPAAILLPSINRPVWFNQAHLFHLSNLPAESREALLELMPEEDLPRHAYFGDGETIPDEYFANIRDAYEKSTIRFPWQPNDVLLLDNLRVCHGRDPFTGARKVLVSMCSPANYSQFRVDGFA